MKFSLIKLIIWPHNPSKEPRVVSFAESGINLITGSSRSGKSAIIKIVDYCLGSRTCSIPKLSPIRRSSAWYGILIRTDEGYKLLARRDPGSQESTDDYMLTESRMPVFPERPTKNANRSSVKGLLSRLARLPQASVDFDDTGSGYKGHPSFGDMTSFMFQPQSVVANERVLFYEADDEKHAPKLREVFPLVLGAVDADTMVKLHRLSDVRRLLERRRRQLDALTAAIGDYGGAVRGRYVTAINLGLLQGEIGSIDEADINLLLSRLRDLVEAWLGGTRPRNNRLSFTAAARLAELRQRESSAVQQVGALRMRQVQLRELSQARQLAEGNLARERDRLEPTSWLVESISQTNNCPFCGSENHAGTSELAKLRDRAASVESQWHGIARVPPMLDAEEVEIRRVLSDEEDGLRQIRAERSQIEQLTTAARKTDEERALFVGKLIEFLAVQRTLSGDDDLAKEIANLENEEKELRTQVDGEVIAQRKEDALLLISKYAQHYGAIVELENNDALIKLDTRELTIRVINERGESAWLYQIGSGANHLGYHVATLLALHEFFVTKPIPYVPSLLILDQPSQTQFPDDLDEEAEQEELLAVHKAFEAFDEGIDRTNGILQVIVSEHAGKTVYSGIQKLTIVERWRRGRKLIPWHWDTEALDELNGQRADWALDDLSDKALKPALAEHLGLTLSEIEEIQVDRATFEQRSIKFQVRTHSHKTHLGADSKFDLNHVVEGFIRQDLSVSITASSAS